MSAQPDRVEVTIGKMMEKFRAILPAEIPAERFCRVAVNALQDSRVMEAMQTSEGQQSIITEIQTAATDGLLLDKREAFLNVYSTKVGNEWIKLAKYMPMYQGLMKLARNSGLLSDIKCDIVKTGDIFAVDKFPPPGECPITHKYPDDAFARGDVRGVYAVAPFLDGGWSNAEVMSVADVEKIRQMSPAKDKDAWTKHWNEMARKTVIRRLTKYLPKSTDGMERLHNAASRGDDYALINSVANTPAIPRKQMTASKLLGHAPAPSQAAPAEAPKPVETKAKPVEQPKAEVLPKEPVKEKAKTQAKTETKGERKKAPPQNAADDDVAGFDERGGGGFQDPMTGEVVDDDDDEDNGV